MKKRLSFLIITATLTIAMTSSVFAASRTLSNGDYGDDVYELQQTLQAYGFFYDAATGYYGDMTEEAVRNFQYYYGLSNDGVAGPTTLGYLGIYSGGGSYDSYDYGSDDYGSNDSYVATEWYSDSSLSRTLSNGMAGNDVYTLQSHLADYGYFYGDLTGFYGDMTEAAVINFQYDYGLTADGIAGPATFSMLGGGYSGSSSYSYSSYYSYTDAILAAVDYTPATSAGYCASWVTQVLRNAGALSYNPGYNANDYWAYVCYSTDLNDLQPGMVVATKYSYSYLGRIYGHVGIYIGNGLIVSSIGYKETLTVDEWNSRYNNTAMGSTMAWGYVY